MKSYVSNFHHIPWFNNSYKSIPGQCHHIDHATKLCHWIIDFYKLNPQRYAHTELNASTTIDYLTQSFQLSTAIGCNNCKENAEGVKNLFFFQETEGEEKRLFYT